MNEIIYNTDYPSENFSNRPPNQVVDKIVLHTTATATTRYALILLTGKLFGFSLSFFKRHVSAHYLISDQQDKKGQCIVYRLVEEDKKAWHAGISRFHEEENLNDSSISIEIVCAGKDHQDTERSIRFSQISDLQIQACANLIKDIKTRYTIQKTNILGHFEISCGRKYDPYPSLLFKSLAMNNLSIWYDETQVNHYRSILDKRKFTPVMHWIQEGIGIYGLDIKITGQLDSKTIIALFTFQRRFRPEKYAGRITDSQLGTAIETPFFKQSFEASLDSVFFAIFSSVIEQIALEKLYRLKTLQMIIDDIFEENVSIQNTNQFTASNP